MTENNAARSIAEEHSKQGTFSFLDRLNNRNYPTEDVEIYLDESLGWEIEKLSAQVIDAKDPEEGEAIQAKIDELRERAKSSRYIIHLEGISSEAYDDIVTQAREEYPLEYREHRNPLTAKLEREVIENEDREIFFRTHLWSKFIRHIEDADGNIDSAISPEFVSVILGHAPLAAQGRIAIAVDQLRMITNWMDDIQGEDFLAKS